MVTENTQKSDESFCRSCGETIKSLAEVCPKCGVRQRESSDEPAEHECRYGAAKVRHTAHLFQMEVWSELMHGTISTIDLTSGDRFDWKAYIRSLGSDAQQVLCCSDLDGIERFSAENIVA